MQQESNETPVQPSAATEKQTEQPTVAVPEAHLDAIITEHNDGPSNNQTLSRKRGGEGMERKGKRHMSRWDDIDFHLPIAEPTLDANTGVLKLPDDSGPGFVMPVKVGNTSAMYISTDNPAEFKNAMGAYADAAGQKGERLKSLFGAGTSDMPKLVAGSGTARRIRARDEREKLSFHEMLETAIQPDPLGLLGTESAEGDTTAAQQLVMRPKAVVQPSRPKDPAFRHFNTGRRQMQAEKVDFGIGTKVLPPEDPEAMCGNCGRKGHTIRRCIKVDLSLFVPGCGLCNDVVHNTDICPRLPDDDINRTLRLVDLFVKCRADLPPLKSDDWAWNKACHELGPGPAGSKYPLLRHQVKRWYDSHMHDWEETWKNHDYNVKVEPLGLRSAVNPKNLAAISVKEVKVCTNAEIQNLKNEQKSRAEAKKAQKAASSAPKKDQTVNPGSSGPNPNAPPFAPTGQRKARNGRKGRTDRAVRPKDRLELSDAAKTRASNFVADVARQDAQQAPPTMNLATDTIQPPLPLMRLPRDAILPEDEDDENGSAMDIDSANADNDAKAEAEAKAAEAEALEKRMRKRTARKQREKERGVTGEEDLIDYSSDEPPLSSSDDDTRAWEANHMALD